MVDDTDPTHPLDDGGGGSNSVKATNSFPSSSFPLHESPQPSAIRHFNPWVEGCVSLGSSTSNPPSLLLALQRDLSSLPLWLEPRGRGEGVVLVEEAAEHSGSRPAFLAYLESLPFPCPSPSFVFYAGGRSSSRTPIALPAPLPSSPPESEHNNLKPLPYRPWGWSPHTASLYSRLSHPLPSPPLHSPSLDKPSPSSSTPWYTGDPEQKRLFGKHWAAALNASILAANLASPAAAAAATAYLASPISLLPSSPSSALYQTSTPCATLAEVLSALSALTEGGGPARGLVIKDAYEGSGRGFVRVKRRAVESGRGAEGGAAAASRASGAGGEAVSTPSTPATPARALETVSEIPSWLLAPSPPHAPSHTPPHALPHAPPASRSSRLLRPEQLGAVRKILKRGPVVVERWLDLRAEFSAHFLVSGETEPPTVTFRGLMNFSATGLGKWLGSHARDPCQNLPPSVRAALFGSGASCFECDGDSPLPPLSPEISAAYEAVRAALEVGLRDTGFRGALSVDSILYSPEPSPEEPAPGLLLKPVSEINLREGMGTLALHLAQYVDPKRAGLFAILSRSHLNSLSGSPLPSVFDFVDSHPLRFNAASQITEGVLRLTEEGGEFMAVLAVAESVEAAKRIAKVEITKVEEGEFEGGGGVRKVKEKTEEKEVRLPIRFPLICSFLTSFLSLPSSSSTNYLSICIKH